VGLLRHEGRWFVDATGRVVGLHGVNFVQKFPPVAPADAGFGADDAAFLSDQGFDVVRLGVVFAAVMPEPGAIDTHYVDSIAATTRVLADAGLYVLLDFHQDGYGPAVHGNGFPEWATLTDGLPNPPEPFPNYYVTNPALQRAFDNFWENRAGPDGVPLQEHYATAVRTVAAAVASEPRVLGYDLMNEPWPGADFIPCVTGCPEIETERLVPFGERMTAAIRAVDAEHIVFSEPFVLFNFGMTDTSLDGIGAPQSGLSFHVYALDPEHDEAVIDRAIAASARGDAIVATEFGATNDVATLHRLTAAFETRLVPWIFWAWDENLIVDKSLPPDEDNIRSAVAEALARPFATATNGTPTSAFFDPDSRLFAASWTTTLPDGRPAPGDLPTTITVPRRAYPDGYTAEVIGGRVLSAPCAAVLQVAQEGGVAEVEVLVSPATGCADVTGE
jgi:endoglycosylceramidase